MNEEEQKKLMQEISEAVDAERQAYIRAYEARLLKSIQNQVTYVIKKNTANLGIAEHSGPSVPNNLRQEIQQLRDVEAIELHNLMTKIGKHLDGEGKIPLVLSEGHRGIVRHQITEDILKGAQQEVGRKISRVKREINQAVSRVEEPTFADETVDNIVHQPAEYSTLPFNSHLIDTTPLGEPSHVGRGRGHNRDR